MRADNALISADSDVGHQADHVLAAFRSGRYAQP
jgi:hypothetical protein